MGKGFGIAGKFFDSLGAMWSCCSDCSEFEEEDDVAIDDVSQPQVSPDGRTLQRRQDNSANGSSEYHKARTGAGAFHAYVPDFFSTCSTLLAFRGRRGASKT